MQPVLEVHDLHVAFHTFDGIAKVLQGVNLKVDKGQRVGLVGESGCGKSVTMRAIMGILSTPPAHITQGEILFRGQNLLTMSPRQRNLLKGRDLTMIFQDPTTSLNPVFRIGEQLDDIVLWANRRSGRRASRRERKARILEVLGQVKLADPERIFDAYPIQLSGGMRQRVLIAMALLNQPTFLIADEPGTALDVTTQDEILRLINELVLDQHLSLLIITHNLGVVREMTDYLYVMYAGTVVEEGRTAAVFADPRHPYTQALLACVPRLSGGGSLKGIEGTLPDYTHPPAGCRFHPRCPHAMEICTTKPPSFTITQNHASACWLQEKQA
jgi:peptide/nickel transport system ATP-binding protein